VCLITFFNFLVQAIYLRESNIYFSPLFDIGSYSDGVDGTGGDFPRYNYIVGNIMREVVCFLTT
jgi:hypothetical protein